MPTNNNNNLAGGIDPPVSNTTISDNFIQEFLATYNIDSNTFKNHYYVKSSTDSIIPNYIEDDIDDDNMSDKKKIEKLIELSAEDKIRATISEPSIVLLNKLTQPKAVNREIYPIGYMGFIVTKASEGVWPIKTPFLTIGHLINNNIYTDNNSSFLEYTKSNTVVRKIMKYIIYDFTNKKIRLIDRRKHESNVNSSISEEQKIAALSSLKYVIKDSKLSGRVFGNPKLKDAVIGQVFTPVEFNYGHSKKLGHNTYYVTVFNEATQKNIKFCIADIEIVLPNLKGYNFPKDKSIVIGSQVNIKSKTSNVYKVVNVYPNSTSKRIRKNCSNRQLDVLELVNINNTQDVAKVYAKCVKVIN